MLRGITISWGPIVYFTWQPENVIDITSTLECKGSLYGLQNLANFESYSTDCEAQRALPSTRTSASVRAVRNNKNHMLNIPEYTSPLIELRQLYGTQIYKAEVRIWIHGYTCSLIKRLITNKMRVVASAESNTESTIVVTTKGMVAMFIGYTRR